VDTVGSVQLLVGVECRSGPFLGLRFVFHGVRTLRRLMSKVVE